LEEKSLIACAVQIGNDLSRLRALGVNVKRRIELMQLARLHDPDQPEGTGVQALTRRYLRMNVDKFGQSYVNDYSAENLDRHLLNYAALDARLHLKLYQAISTLVASKTGNGGVIEAPDSLSEGTQARLRIGTMIVASVEVVFVGASQASGGQSKRWGDILCGKGKAIVKLLDVVEGKARVPFLLKTKEICWPSGTDLNTVMALHPDDPQILVNTSSLHLVDLEQPDASRPAAAAAEPSTGVDVSEIFQSNGDDDDDGTGLLSGDNPIQFDGSIDDDADDDDYEVGDENWSRKKEDLWHQLKNVPLAKQCPLSQFLAMLLICATFVFETEGFEATKKVVMEKRGVPANKIMEHFLYNKEWWRQRVRMPVHKPKDHEANIERVERFCRENEHIKPFWSDDLQKYFRNFRSKIREGKFAELNDVATFRYNGKDSNGLDLWIRLKGSVRNELAHQKIRNVMGPWAMGCEVAHYILLILGFSFNVSTGIRRAGRPDFGHKCHWLIDEIQLLVQDIYDVWIYPDHPNVSCFSATDFVSFGIGPLTDSEDFVDEGPPMDHLRGDMRKLAARLGVKCPPLESSTEAEYQIETEYFLRHPKATSANFVELAKIFKTKYDGLDIFPKLPSQIQASYNRWKQRDATRKFKRNILPEYNQMIEGFVSQRVDGSDIQLNFGQAIPPQPNPEVERQLFVPPAAAPRQQAPVADTGRLLDDEPARKKRCAWFPLCNSLASSCGGTKRSTCRRAGVDFSVPQTEAEKEDFRKKKAQATKEINAKRMSEMRNKRKRNDGD
jgi:hypothetical protein